MRKKNNTEQLSIPGTEQTEPAFLKQLRENNVPIGNSDFESQSPLLNEDVIERKNDIVLEAQVPPEPTPEAEAKEANPAPATVFSKPKLNTPPADTLQTQAKEEPLPVPPSQPAEEEQGQPQADKEDPEKPEEQPGDDLPKMKGEPLTEGTTMAGIQKKAGQTTAKWSWTMFENAGPKLQLFLTELDEADFRKYVLEDLMPADALEFAKNYNESLEEEFRIKDWEKELIYPPLEEMLEQAGMNASMSPGARFGLGLTVVLGARAMQTRKYRKERDELVSKLLSTYANSKEEGAKGKE